MLDVASGLRHMHAHGVVHKDVKPDNLVVFSQFNIKITDFGLSRSSISFIGGSKSSTGAGTYNYNAPEIRNGEHATTASDVFALGMTLGSLLVR